MKSVIGNLMPVLCLFYLGIGPIHAQPAIDSTTKAGIYLLIRGDDLGSSHTANVACIESYRNGIMRSVEIMVPGPWFPEAVRLLNENPGLDVGIHLVITSEWSTLKWRPLTYCPSLVDKDGYFFPMIWQRSDFPKGTALNGTSWKIKEIEKEFRAQIETAKRYLPRVSHVNCHMGCESCDPEISSLVKKLAEEYELVIDLKELGYKHIDLWNRDDTSAAQRIGSALNCIKNLEPGRYFFIEHPGLNTSEMQAIWHKGYENVAADRDGVTKVFTNPGVKDLIRLRNISLISYKQAGGQAEKSVSVKPGRPVQINRQNDYSMYTDIFQIIRTKFQTLGINGTTVYNKKLNSFTLSTQVLYVINDMIVADISFVGPGEVENIEFFEDSEASAYGMRGANGVLKITLKYK
jgi:chitin disaccharide deacetylase